MRILIIIGESIDSNSSTNIFKRVLIDELAKMNDITVMMANNSENVSEQVQYVKSGITFIEFSRLLPVDRLFRNIINQKKHDKDINEKEKINNKESGKHKKFIKMLYNSLYTKHIEIFYPKYRYCTKWMQRSGNYTTSINYDAIISISHPPVSHKVAMDLILKNNIKCKKWIQIWFEPWFQVPFKKNKTKLIIQEERNLIRNADFIFYVNPIFLNNQKLMFPEYASKMKCIDLPVVIKEKNEGMPLHNSKAYTVGYFGNYFSSIRNIKPFYNAISNMDNIKCLIVGDTDLSLKPMNNLTINSRISHDQIQKYENQVDILVILSNLSEQIPGKVYNYSSSNKFVLFILDGNSRTKRALKDYFSQFNRYVFCENNEEDIKEKIRDIIKGNYSYVKNEPIQKFHVGNIVNKLLNNISEEKNV